MLRSQRWFSRVRLGLSVYKVVLWLEIKLTMVWHKHGCISERGLSIKIWSGFYPQMCVYFFPTDVWALAWEGWLICLLLLFFFYACFMCSAGEMLLMSPSRNRQSNYYYFFLDWFISFLFMCSVRFCSLHCTTVFAKKSNATNISSAWSCNA